MRYHVRYALLIGALLAFIAGYVVFWFITAQTVKADVGTWIATKNASGYRVSTAGYRVSGFPSTLILTIDQMKIAKPAAGWAWSAPKVLVFVQPWNLHHIIVDFGKEQRFAVAFGAVRQGFALHAVNAKASALLGKNFHIAALDSILAGAKISMNGGAVLDIGEMQAHARTNKGQDAAQPAGSVEIAVFAKNVTLPAGMGGLMGRGVKSFAIEATAPPPLPSGLDALGTWRQDGGTIKIDHFDLDWGALTIAGSGTATLDKEMRPEAAFTTTVGGYDQAIDALVAAGELKAVNGVRAKIVLGLLARRGKNGERELEIPLTAEDGRLYAGPVALASLPALAPAANVPPAVSVSPLPTLSSPKAASH
jgi:hypothetical protein